jgi:hypothetical protein
MKNSGLIISAISILFLLNNCTGVKTPLSGKPRTIITTDGEVDDGLPRISNSTTVRWRRVISAGATGKRSRRTRNIPIGIWETKKRGRSQYDFISEGDSPAYFYLLDVGLRNLGDPSSGGWGGRMVRPAENPNRWEDGAHVTDYNHNPYTRKDDTAYPQTRWVEVLQNDFAAAAYRRSIQYGNCCASARE